MSTPAVLLLIFRRPELARRQIGALRLVQPRRIYVAADGPRPDRPMDNVACAAARRALEGIDWPCQVKTLFRTTNLGVKLAVSQAIDWFFESEEAGVILEEDCLPHPDFFWFCESLLDRYRNDIRVMQISGTNFQPLVRTQERSFFFSRYSHVWGWATLRRAWRLYRANLEGLESFLEEATENHFWENRREQKYWRKILQIAKADRVQSWAYRWTYTLWAEGGLCVYPEVNLVTNLGFGDGATNTQKTDRLKAGRGLHPLLKLIHPSTVMRCRDADLWTFEHLYWGEPLARAWHHLERLGELVSGFVERVTTRTNSALTGVFGRFRTKRDLPLAPVAPASAYTRPRRSTSRLFEPRQRLRR